MDRRIDGWTVGRTEKPAPIPLCPLNFYYTPLLVTSYPLVYLYISPHSSWFISTCYPIAPDSPLHVILYTPDLSLLVILPYTPGLVYLYMLRPWFTSTCYPVAPGLPIHVTPKPLVYPYMLPCTPLVYLYMLPRSPRFTSTCNPVAPGLPLHVTLYAPVLPLHVTL